MSTAELDALVLAALKRLTHFINRTTAQHKRRMVQAWSKPA